MAWQVEVCSSSLVKFLGVNITFVFTELLLQRPVRLTKVLLATSSTLNKIEDVPGLAGEVAGDFLLVC